MKSWIALAALGLALVVAGGCSSQREEAPGEGAKGPDALEHAAQEGAAAEAAKSVAGAADAAAREVEKKGVAGTAEAVAEGAEKRVEESTDLLKEQYDESRKEGEGKVQAAGQGYDAVLDAGKTDSGSGKTDPE